MNIIFRHRQRLIYGKKLMNSFAREYAIRNVQETKLGLDMNGTHQVLAYVDDVNLPSQI